MPWTTDRAAGADHVMGHWGTRLVIAGASDVIEIDRCVKDRGFIEQTL